MAHRIAKALSKLRSQVNSRWPDRNKASDGWIGDTAHQATNSDHNPHVKDGTTGVVTALDITHDPKSGCDAGVVAEVLIASRDPRIKYIIWNHQILAGDAGQSPWKWRGYQGKNPHTRHVHLSVKATKAMYDDERPWAVPGGVAPSQPSAPAPTPTKRATLKRGAKGADVRHLQKLLGIEVDGVFGADTEAAVRKAQAKHGLGVDGVVGPYTWEALTK